MKNYLSKTTRVFIYICSISFTFGQTEPTWSNSGYSSSTPVPYSFRMGNVMIGSSNYTTGAKLYVFGSGNTAKDVIVNGRMQSGDAGGNGGLWVGTDDKTFVGRYGANIGFYNNGVWRFQVDPSGKVGIGTSAPAQNLDVVGNIVTDGLALSRTGTQRGVVWFNMVGDNNHKLYNNYYNIDGQGIFDGIKWNVYNGIQIKTGNAGATTALAIDVNGNVGIGTTTPSQKLEVAGSIKANGLVFPDGTSQTTANPFSYSSNFASGSIAQPFQSTWTFQQSFIVVNWGQILNQVSINSPLAVGGDVNANGNLAVVGNMKMIGGITSNLNILQADGGNNTDPMSIGRVNNGANYSDLIINIGDDNLGDDKFVIGSSPGGTFTKFFEVTNQGFVYARKSIVTQNAFPDYVFDSKYELQSLEEVEKYVKENKHLPGIPTAKEVAEEGLDTGEMLKMQMEKIEELTLHIIRQQKEIDALKTKVK